MEDPPSFCLFNSKTTIEGLDTLIGEPSTDTFVVQPISIYDGDYYCDDNSEKQITMTAHSGVRNLQQLSFSSALYHPTSKNIDRRMVLVNPPVDTTIKYNIFEENALLVSNVRLETKPAALDKSTKVCVSEDRLIGSDRGICITNNVEKAKNAQLQKEFTLPATQRYVSFNKAFPGEAYAMLIHDSNGYHANPKLSYFDDVSLDLDDNQQCIYEYGEELFKLQIVTISHEYQFTRPNLKIEASTYSEARKSSGVSSTLLIGDYPGKGTYQASEFGIENWYAIVKSKTSNGANAFITLTPGSNTPHKWVITYKQLLEGKNLKLSWEDGYLIMSVERVSPTILVDLKEQTSRSGKAIITRV